jgi:serine/threonine-protein phosphatase 2A regulatory subunit B
MATFAGREEGPSCSVEQCFAPPNDGPPNDEGDAICSVAFCSTGAWLGVGDRGGRVRVYARKGAHYAPFCAFRSHEPEFDFLKSLEVEEKVSQLQFCGGRGARCGVLAANDRTIKLWSVGEERVGSRLENTNKENGYDELRVPRVAGGCKQARAKARATYAREHAYHVHSLSVCADGETFLSADDLRVNLWRLDLETRCCNVVDAKPPNMEDLAEVITTASFHPNEGSTLLYATSRGAVKTFDLRVAACCARPTLVFDATSQQAPASEDGAASFFAEIVASVSDARFDGDGRFVVTRDFLYCRTWDVRCSREPVHTAGVHEHLRPQLADLYEADRIFDKFEVCACRGDGAVATGGYGRCAIREAATGLALDAALVDTNGAAAPRVPLAGAPVSAVDVPDASNRVLHLAAHPREETFAAAQGGRCYLLKVHR